mgnify:CR=1 FL=1
MNDTALSSDAVTAGIRAAYDAVDYDCTADPQSHPDRLRTVARMFGVDAPPLATARVLEVGCGDGSNLIPVADAFPQRPSQRGIEVVKLFLEPVPLGRIDDDLESFVGGLTRQEAHQIAVSLVTIAT